VLVDHDLPEERPRRSLSEGLAAATEDMGDRLRRPRRREDLSGIFKRDDEADTANEGGDELSSIIRVETGKPEGGGKGLSDALAGIKSAEEETGASEPETEMPAESAKPEGEVTVCQADLDAPPLILAGDPPDAPAFAAGIVKPDQLMTAYWYDDYADVLTSYGFRSRLRLPENTVTTIAIPGDRTYTVGDVTVFPIKLPDQSGLEVNVDGSMPEELPSDPLRFAVFGDRASVALSGLDRLEEELVKKGADKNWSVEWFEIGKDGSLSDKVVAGSFAELVGMAGGDSEPAYLSSPESFDRLVTAMEKAIISEESPLDQVFWVTEGYLVPNSAPSRLETFLQNVNAHGNVARREDNSPYKWLQVVAGYFAQDFSAAYISGPIATSQPVAGDMSVEDRKGERTVLLTDMKYPLATVRNLIRRNASAAGAPEKKADYDPNALAYDSRQMFEDIGVVFDRDFAERINQSLSPIRFAARDIADGADFAKNLQADNVDITALLDLRTGDTGALKGLELDPANFKRRVERYLKENNMDQFEAALDEIGRITIPMLNREDEANCNYYFLPGSALGLAAEGK
jgi:hypothetical protein